MTSPNSHHPDGHPNLDPDLHPARPSSPQHQRSYQPRPSQSSPQLQSQSPQTSPLHLPTSRQFLTSLITAISNIPLLSSEPAPTQIHKPAPTPGLGHHSEGVSQITEESEHTVTTETNRRKQLLQILKEEGEGDGEGQEGQGDIISATTSEFKAKNGGGGGSGGGGGNGNINPLKLVPPEYRHLIITLHVLFPGVVLPGLEVLERGLVERVVLRCAGEAGVVKKEEQKEQKEQKEKGDVDVDVDVVMGGDDNDGDANRGGDCDGDTDKHEKEKHKSQHESKAERRRPPEFYLVRSSQPLNTHPKRKRKNPSSNLSGLHGDADTEGIPSGVGEADRERDRIHTQRRYIVSLEAWNCTCAAFAFACVSSELGTDDSTVMDSINNHEADVTTTATTTATTREQGKEGDGERERQRDKKGSAGWTFGGMTLFDAGDHSSVPPVCKHLLACLLADKWRRALGRYVTERMVGREEMAGIVADV